MARVSERAPQIRWIERDGRLVLELWSRSRAAYYPIATLSNLGGRWGCAEWPKGWSDVIRAKIDEMNRAKA